MRVALGQFNASVGDIAGNLKTMRRFYDEASEFEVDVLAFPEVCVCGYPPEDLLLRKYFLIENRLAIERLATDCPKMTIIVGFAEIDGNQCFNSLAVLENGRIKKIYRKGLLPNYGVFDEQRYFQQGNAAGVVDINGMSVVLTICEDIWQLEWLDEFLKDVSHKDVIINISASPFHMGKIGQRQEVLSRCARHFDCPVAYCNLVGGQDELVFDGRSMFLNSSGDVVGQAKAFAEDLLVTDITLDDTGNKSETAVGYATLYGDTAGGFAVIKDVPKTMVYQLAEYRNSICNRQIIPVTVIKRPPSAELRKDQKDIDSLPDYDLLDKILKRYVEEDKSAQELIDHGLAKDVVNRVIRMVDLNEYKRRQSPPGVRISPKAFGKDRRMPITNGYRR